MEVPFRIAWYGILIIAALALSLFIALKLAKKYDLDSSHVLSLSLATIPGGLIGARLFHVIDKFDFYLANPKLIPLFWEGGFSQYGMIIGGLVSALLYAYWQKLPFIKFLDLIPVPVLVGLSIGRIGCSIQGCCHGSPTGLPWAFIFTHPHSFITPELRGVPVHPTQAYEIVWFLSLAGILLGLRQYLQPIKGMSFLSFLIGHSIGRFIIMFFRGDYPELQILAGLTQAQIIALVIFFISTPLLFTYCRKARREKKSSFSP